MKKRNQLLIIQLVAFMFIAQSCGPVVFSSSLETAPPVWFYPNRVETIRYVYFPDYMIYYDLSLGNYIYLNNGAWVRVKVLPQRYRSFNLRQSQFVRVKNYRGDNISEYHRANNSNNRRSSNQSNNKNRRN